MRRNAETPKNKSFNQQVKELDEELRKIQFSILKKGEYKDIDLNSLTYLSLAKTILITGFIIYTFFS